MLRRVIALLIGTFLLTSCATHRSLDGYQSWPEIIQRVIEEYGKPDYIRDDSGSHARVRKWGDRPNYQWAVESVILFYIDSRTKIEIKPNGFHEEPEPMEPDELELISELSAS